MSHNLINWKEEKKSNGIFIKMILTNHIHCFWHRTGRSCLLIRMAKKNYLESNASQYLRAYFLLLFGGHSALIFRKNKSTLPNMIHSILFFLFSRILDV